MKSLCILFLIPVVMSSVVFAQAQETSEPKAYKFDEFGKISNREFDKRFTKFLVKLQYEEPISTGYIINSGKASEVSKRELKIRDGTRRCHHCRIVIVNGGKSKVLKTAFWIVPQGAEPPTP